MSKTSRHIAEYGFVLLLAGLTILFLNSERLVAQQKSGSQQNADGSTTTFENLPGGGVRATTKDAQGKVIDTVTSEPDAKYPISFQIGPGDYIELWDRPFTAKLDDQPLTKLRLLDQKKKPVTEVDFHTSQKPMRLNDFSVPPNGTGLEDFYLPTAGTFGNLLQIQAKDLIKFDDFLKPNSGVFIGNQPMPIIAASPHEIITRVDYEMPGPTEIEIKLGPFTFKKSFRVLKLDLAADKLNLSKYESTDVHITVHGLQKLRAPAHMKIVVTGAVKMIGASEVVIPPAEISADGTYSTTRVLEAGEPGPFGMNVTVTVDKEP